MDLCPKHDSCKCEEEDGFKTEEDQQQHGHPRGEVTAFYSQKEIKKVDYFVVVFFKGVAQLHLCCTHSHLNVVTLGAEKVRCGSALAAWCNYSNLCCCSVIDCCCAIGCSSINTAVSGSYVNKCTSIQT